WRARADRSRACFPAERGAEAARKPSLRAVRPSKARAGLASHDYARREETQHQGKEEEDHIGQASASSALLRGTARKPSAIYRRSSGVLDRGLSTRGG